MNNEHTEDTAANTKDYLKICAFCKRKFLTSQGRASHELNVHLDEHACPICGRPFRPGGCMSHFV